jgi:formamidopyrimidine-DNA glycosylase
MIMHMRMEGKFYIKNADEIKSPYEHVIFTLSDKRQMRYHDVRKFGTIHLIDKSTYLNTYPINGLGKEPKDIDPIDFYHLIHHRKTAIKNVLLDQHVISGLGNIYVDETLFLSKVHPKRSANRITKKEAAKLVESARQVLNKAIALGGTTIRSYTSSLGVHGRFQNELNVHTKYNEPCPICGTSIVKMKVGGRTSYVCLTCQK